MSTKKILILFFFFTGFSFFLYAQQAKGFEITGHLEGLKDGENAVLTNRFAAWPRLDTVDLCIVKNGEFHLKGSAIPAGGPRYYEVAFSNHPPRMILFLNGGDKISIKGGDINQIKKDEFQDQVSIQGCTSCTSLHTLLPVFREYFDKYGVVGWGFKKLQDSIGFDYASAQKLVEAKQRFDSELDTILRIRLADSLKPAIPMLLTTYFENYHAPFIVKLYHSLDNPLKNSFHGKELGKRAALAIGQPLPVFNLPTPDGKKIALKSVVAKNKITLVHLWASNSFERQQFQDELLMFYKKYHGRGLEIIALSSDTDRTDWEFFVIKKKLPWINVSDLKGNLAGSITEDVYMEGGHSVPNTTNILLDHEGKIIAWDVYGPELQYYLSKYLGK